MIISSLTCQMQNGISWTKGDKICEGTLPVVTFLTSESDSFPYRLRKIKGSVGSWTKQPGNPGVKRSSTFHHARGRPFSSLSGPQLLTVKWRDRTTPLGPKPGCASQPPDCGQVKLKLLGATLSLPNHHHLGWCPPPNFIYGQLTRWLGYTPWFRRAFPV